MNESLSAANPPVAPTTWRRECRETARHAFLLLALMAAIYAPVWLAGKTLIPWTGLDQHDWAKDATRPLTRTALDTADTDFLVLPWDEYALRCMRHGEWPWWNPYQGLGHPHWENMVTNGLSPGMWLEAALPAGLKEFVWLGQLWVAGIFTMMLARALGIGWGGTAIAGVAVITAPHFALYLTQRHMLGAAMWWPLALWGVECLRHSFSSDMKSIDYPIAALQTRLLGFCGAVSGTLGLTAGGNPSVTLAGGVGLFVYALFRIPIGAGFRTALVWTGWLGLAGISAVLLAAPSWMNFFPWLTAGYSRTMDPIFLAAGNAGRIVFAPRHIGTMLLPYIYGPPMEYPYGHLSRWLWSSFGGWYPAIVVFLSLAGIFRAWTRRHAPMFVLGFLTLAAIARSYGAPGTNWIGALPLWRDVIFPRYVAFIPVYGFALLAAYGFEAFCCDMTWSKIVRRRVIVGGLWLLSMALLLWLAFKNLSDAGSWSAAAITHWRYFSWLGLFWSTAPVLAFLWLIGIPHKDEKSELAQFRNARLLWPTLFGLGLTQVVFVPWGYSPLTYSIIGLAGGLLLLAATFSAIYLDPHLWISRHETGARTILPRGVARVACWAGVAILPLCVSTWARFGLPPKFDPIPRTGLVQTLSRLESSDYSRSWSLDGLPIPNQAMPLGIFSLNVIDGLITREEASYSSRYIDSHCPPIWLAGNDSFLRTPGPTPLEEYSSNRAFYEFASVRYVTSLTPLPGLRPLLHDDAGMILFEDSAALPRVRLVTPELAAMLPPDAMRLGMERGLGRAEIQSFRANEVTIVATNTKPCVVVLADAPKSGWNAWLNGHVVPMLTAHGCFRAVSLPDTGSWKIIMRYRPPWWTTSWILAGAGLICFALSCAWLCTRNRLTS